MYFDSYGVCYAVELLQCSNKAKARERGHNFLLYRPKWDLLYGYLVWDIFTPWTEHGQYLWFYSQKYLA